MIALAFTPGHAVIGGVILGSAVVAKLSLTGRVLGVSGAFKGIIAGKTDSPWRYAFLGGLMAAAMLSSIPDLSFTSSGRMVAPLRGGLAGFLVGWGTARGNGCTSGHGICGNARLSPRSMAATATFMAFGALSATLFSTNDALGISPTSAINNIMYPSAHGIMLGGVTLAGTLVVFSALHVAGKALLQKSDKDKGSLTDSALELVSEATVGVVFGTGLLISGMLDPAKVSGFLTVSSAWDPSLAMVMIGALGVTAPAYWMLTSGDKPLLPACRRTADGMASGAVDVKLLTGAAVFGIGWGLAGICPGPAIVFFATNPTNITISSWLFGFLSGQWTHSMQDC